MSLTSCGGPKEELGYEGYVQGFIGGVAADEPRAALEGQKYCQPVDMLRTRRQRYILLWRPPYRRKLVLEVAVFVWSMTTRPRKLKHWIF